MSTTGPLTPEARSLIGRIGAETSWANTLNRAERTSKGRAAFDQRFLDKAGGDPVRAAHLRRAHFARISLKSAQSRRKAAELTLAAEAAEAELAVLSDAGGGPRDA